jgi:CHAT domain-containing protein
VESLRASLAGQRWRASAFAARQTAYELLVDIRMRQHQAAPSAGHDAAAFEAGERARARGLLELLAEGRIDVAEGIAPELRAEERALRRRLNSQAAAQEEALAARREARAQGLAREIQETTARLVDLEALLRSGSPRYAALTRPPPLGLAAVREDVLDAETQLLEYALGEGGSWLWVVSRERLDSFSLAPRAEIESAARRAREQVSTPATGSGAADELSRLVLAPAASALRAKRLLIVAPDALQYVPFAALPLPAPSGKALVSRFEVVTLPSASVLATLRNERRETAAGRKVVAVFADPVFDPSDPRVRPVSRPSGTETQPPEAVERALRGVAERGVLARLPFSRQEAEAIVELAPRGHVFQALGFEATREAATSPRLADYRFVHFATHGVLNTRQPELSGVVLSLVDRAGRRQDGFLRLHDVYNLRLGADLVVLSGCQTGLGKETAGEGLVGLTRGFMFAGAPRVVASLWPVDDLATSELMKRFYRGMLRDALPPAAALRGAQLELSAVPRWSRPYYWAGFVLQGEWER